MGVKNIGKKRLLNNVRPVGALARRGQQRASMDKDEVVCALCVRFDDLVFVGWMEWMVGWVVGKRLYTGGTEGYLPDWLSPSLPCTRAVASLFVSFDRIPRTQAVRAWSRVEAVGSETTRFQGAHWR